MYLFPNQDILSQQISRADSLEFHLTDKST